MHFVNLCILFESLVRESFFCFERLTKFADICLVYFLNINLTYSVFKMDDQGNIHAFKYLS